MNVKEIKELVDLVARRGLAGLEVERAGFRLRIEGPRAELPAFGRTAHRVLESVPVAAPAALPPALPEVVRPPALAQVPAPEREPSPEERGLHLITSPIVGTFYRAPNPEADPFVKVGDAVDKGQTLCIVEAMKLMNEIESDVAGTVVEILPQNGQPIEYGERLFLIKVR